MKDKITAKKQNEQDILVENLELVPISLQDIDCFDGTEYKNLSTDKRRELIENSLNGSYNGKYFEFYLLKLGGETIGLFNVCAHSKSVISVAPEIKENFRQKGYGTAGMHLSLLNAKQKGYKVAIATVREENLASIKLHDKLNFERVMNYEKNGKPIRTYLKVL